MGTADLLQPANSSWSLELAPSLTPPSPSGDAGWQVQQRPGDAPPPPPRRQLSSASQQDAATRLSGEAPVTPLVWIVVWASMTVEWALNYNIGITQVVWFCPPFQQQFMPGVLQPMQQGGATRQPGKLPATVRHGNTSITAVVLATYHVSKAIAVPVAALVVRRHGRPACLLVGALLYMAGVLLGVSAFNAAQLLLGLAVPGASAAFLHLAVLLADIEVAPSRTRGAIAVAGTLGATSGYSAAYVVMLAPQLRLAPWGWRVAWGMALLPVVALLAAWRWLPESPVSLVQRGRVAAGREALRSIRGPLYSAAALEQELSDMQAAAGMPHVGARGWVLAAEWRELRLLFSRAHAPMLAVVSGLLVLFELVSKNTKLWSLAGWMAVPTQHLHAANMVLAHRFLPRAAAFASFSVVGTAGALLLVDSRAGRRGVVVVGAACSGLVVAVMAAILELHVGGADISNYAQSRLLFALYGLWYAASSTSYAPLAAIRAEHFALEVRSSAVALGLLLEHVVRVASILMQDVRSHSTQWTVMIPFALAGYVLEACLAAAALPEAKGVPLERVAAVWRVHWLWLRWYARPPHRDKS